MEPLGYMALIICSALLAAAVATLIVAVFTLGQRSQQMTDEAEKSEADR